MSLPGGEDLWQAFLSSAKWCPVRYETLCGDSKPDHLIEPSSGSKSLKWWTRSQRIGTFAEVPVEAAILEPEVLPNYQQIAPKALQLQQVGMTSSAIARRFGVTGKTVTKSVTWLRRAQRRPDGQEYILQSTLRVK